MLSRERGLAEWTLKDVAALVGMRAPSLYTHFQSKLSIYDAMYGQAWSEYEALMQTTLASKDFPTSAREAMKAMSHLFFDFAVADPARYQLTWVSSTAVPSRPLLGGLINQQLANDPGGTSRKELLDRAVDMWCDSVGLTPEPQEGEQK